MTNKPPKDFAVFILTHGRPDKVLTYDCIRKQGYTGPIYLVIDDIDKTGPQYKEKYGNEVIVFDKRKIAKTFDNGDNFQDMRASVHARNAIFEIAKKMKIKYFIQLDDDYFGFMYKFDDQKEFRTNPHRPIKNLNGVFSIMLDFFIKTNVTSVAMAQEGDFSFCSEHRIYLKRKCMNSWICSIDRPFTFTGRMNDDVNAYIRNGTLGKIFFTINQVSLQQPATQSVEGGMTEIYKAAGTYVKSFYTVMFQPSSVKVGMIIGRSGEKRLHHHIYWNRTVPQILRESVKR